MTPLSDMRRDLRHLTQGLLIAFVIVALSAGFWGVVRSGGLLARDDNARNVIREQQIARGTILDRDGEVLAVSTADANGIMHRSYPDVSVTGAVGYYSLRYGTAGIEAAYDAILRGDDSDEWARELDRLLHRPQAGSDIRTTIDLDVQRAAAEALGAHAGAVIVLDVPSGEVLGMVSAPGYDPNRLDQQWDALTENKQTSPLLNRVTAGLYQPGGALQSVILAAMLGTHTDLPNSGADVLNAVIEDANADVTVESLTLSCLEGVPQIAPLTLAQAYVYGCPAPFAQAFDSALTPAQLQERFTVLGLLAAPELNGFQTQSGSLPDALSADLPDERLIAELVGQGALTVTPLQMVQFVAAVANRGNGVPLTLVEAVRAPESDEWQPVESAQEHPALLRNDVAAGVRLAMLQAAARSVAVRQAQTVDGSASERVLYGHAALAYAGPDETPYAWFLGFLDLTEGDTSRAIAVVVVVEDEADPGIAAAVAGAAFSAAVGD